MPKDCGRMYFATHGWFIDGVPSAEKLAANIKHNELIKRVPTILVIDCELVPPIPTDIYVNLIKTAKSMLPNWSVIPYVWYSSDMIAADATAYWKEILTKSETDSVYLAIHRNHDSAYGVQECYNYIAWAKGLVSSPRNVVASTIPYRDETANWRSVGSFISDIGEVIRNKCTVGLFMPNQWQQQYNEYRNLALQVVRNAKLTTSHLKEMSV